MHSKICVVLLLGVAVANAVIVPVLHHVHDDHSPAEYHFEYSVHDDHTGDIKSQHEERHGDKVTGQYTLVDADGYRRVVDYSSDKHTGFVANVHRELLNSHHSVAHAVPKKAHLLPAVQGVKLAVPAPVVHHAVPAVHHVQAVHHAEPVRHVQLHHAAPEVHFLKPVGQLKQSHNAHSHTSFKSGSVSYQY